MKIKFLLFSIIICQLMVYTAKGQGGTLPLNGSGNGSFAANVTDTWQVTTNADGLLQFTITTNDPNNYVNAVLYDNNGTTVISSTGTATPGNPAVVNTDGLAAGTYIIKVFAYSAGQSAAYTLADKLTPAPVTNDVEPNNSRSQALVLTLNDSTTGHVGYYYNNHRDTADWYKVTTNSDGLLRLTITTEPSTLNAYINCTLYDNNGITVLNAKTTGGATSSVLNTDGLAAGTYYVKMSQYNTNDYVSYKLADSLFVPPVANDAEPDSTRAFALTLPLDGGVTGHVGYYYNNHRDTSDWYKVTTTSDGLLRLNITTEPSSLNAYINCTLYDNNGITVLNANTTGGATSSVLSTDGLAAGTYYVKMSQYNNNDYVSYKLADSLFVPPVANDAEPDSTRALALTLPLNGGVTGHVGYYYNNHRDTADWYKVTTNSDGLLRLTITTEPSTLNAYINCTLYDNNGIAVLNAKTTGSATTSVLSTDGLAAGTYYVKMSQYNINDYVSYKLADSLFAPPVANDAEPDSTRALALTLPLNGGVTGHVGYYYNNHRDTADWYKVTTNSDGLLRLTITTEPSTLNAYINCTLYDNNGIAVLNANTTGNATTSVLNTDGLAAGTYYVKMSQYNSTDYVSYKLADSLFTYKYAADTAYEPNGHAAQAHTILSDSTVTGHFGFYYNNQRDTTDWFKINYTNTSGNLDLTINLLPHLSDGALNYANFYVYKDTSAASVYQKTFGNTSNPVNLTGLTQGYYYIKITQYNTNDFNAYSITNSFTQVNVAAISLLKSASHNACGTDSLIYGLSGSHSPYTVRLYRNGALYDSLTTASDSAVFGGLNDGNYYATVFGDGATDAAFGKSAVTQLLPPTPAGLTTTKISLTSAQLNWNAIGCVKNYQIQYMIMGGSTWTTINTNLNTTYNLTGLTMDTTYSWRVASIDTVNSIALTSVYSDTVQFTTLLDTARIAFVSVTPVNDCSNTSKLQYQITHSKPPYSVQLYRFGVAYGTPVIVNDKNPFTISNLPAGIYYATAFGNKDAGALGSSNSSTILPPIPTGLNATKVMDHSATLNWSMLSCTTYDTLEYRANDTATWKILITKDNSGTYDLANLAGNVTYLFRVASVVVVNGQKLSSGFSSTFTFTTLIDLPVTLVNFSATANNDIVTLNWSTATELNDKGFEIFRSADGTNFTSIGFVAGAGNSNLLLNYQFTDKPGLSGNVFYRLKQVDLDGNFAWSNIAHVTMNGSQTITFMPNPAKSFITIASPVNVKEVRLLSISGQILKVWQNVSPNAQLDLGSIASGTYLIQFVNDQSSQTMKLVKSN